jgi:hypothetical protein
MTDLANTVDTYLEGWNETQPARRAELIHQVWAPDGRLIDPPLDATGQTEISEMAASLHAQFPEHYFRRSSGIDEHHGHFRFAWELVSPDGAVAMTGLDVGELAPDGSIARITGFFGDLPSEQVA